MMEVKILGFKIKLKINNLKKTVFLRKYQKFSKIKLRNRQQHQSKRNYKKKRKRKLK